MSIHTYRANSLHEALDLVRRDLGPDAAVLHTREVAGMLGWLSGSRQIEVAASNTVEVPSRLPAELALAAQPPTALGESFEQDFAAQFRREFKSRLDDSDSLVEDLCRDSDAMFVVPPSGGRPAKAGTTNTLPEPLQSLLAELAAGGVPDDLAREFVLRLRLTLAGDEVYHEARLKARLAGLIADEIDVRGPIQVVPGRRRLVALVGPTGVGKTTTLAKLAAHFRLREERSVGLIAADTYRIAAIDQLETYAGILNVPLEVAATPRQMREALARLGKLDVIFLDTAGRSPRDETQLRELKALLAEAQPDEIHLVLSAAAPSATLAGVARSFTALGASALLLTKLDENLAPGGLLPLLCRSRLPLGYITHGQNVPDDIGLADRGRLARLILGMERADA